VPRAAGFANAHKRRSGADSEREEHIPSAASNTETGSAARIVARPVARWTRRWNTK
jgi:hypothetical protein